MAPRRQWWPYLVATVIPVVTAIVFWAVLPARFRANESADYVVFHDPVARAVLAGKGLVLPDGRPALLYPPGHPLIIAATLGAASALGISESSAIDVLLLLCLALSSLLLFAISSRVWGTKGGLLTSLGWS